MENMTRFKRDMYLKSYFAGPPDPRQERKRSKLYLKSKWTPKSAPSQVDSRLFKFTEEISERLTKTFVTPLEREDIDALALALYKIPKTLEKFAERFQISPPNLPKSAFQRQSELLQQAMETLELMVRELRSSPDLAKIKDQNLKLQYLEGEADKLMVARLKDLYNSPHDAISVVALKDLYDLLEKVIDRCRDAGNVIAQIVLKNS